MLTFNLVAALGVMLTFMWRVQPTAGAVNQRFFDLLAKMEVDVLELAREIEDLYIGRCANLDLASCFGGNYDHCRSALPQPECLASPEWRIPQCGDSEGPCSGSWDFSTSNVWIPSEATTGTDGNPAEKEVVESICLTQNLDDYFVQKRAQDSSYWAEYNTEPHGMYFGTKDGAFRIFPARQAATCNTYDPRVRPWYVAGSSGPKNVVMILDVSGSMAGRRLDFLKTAAKRVVDTLGIYDRVGIVPFSTRARIIGGLEDTLLTGSKENKERLLQEIDDLTAAGSTNFREAFDTAFHILDRSYENELQVDCNTAIIFLTDGEMTTKEISIELVMDEIVDGIAERQGTFGNPITLFTYSISDDDSVDRFPKELSCRVDNGIWSRISNEREIVDSLSGYYRLFALELGQTEDFTSWVEPYTFSTGKVTGTTVSAPVYDRTLDPPVFLGVAAIDFTLQSLDIALGNSIGSQNTIDEFIARPAICPDVKLTKCMLESYRRRGLGGDEALCFGTDQFDSCTSNEFAQFEPSKCSFQADYPSNLWDNIEYQNVDYEERTCCNVGMGIAGPEDIGVCKAESSSENDSPENDFSKIDPSESGGLSTGGIIGIVIGAAVVVYYACVACILIRRHREDRKSIPNHATPSVIATPIEQPVTDKIDTYSGLDAMHRPPPYAPATVISNK